jgi:hypothetical protein
MARRHGADARRCSSHHLIYIAGDAGLRFRRLGAQYTLARFLCGFGLAANSAPGGADLGDPSTATRLRHHAVRRVRAVGRARGRHPRARGRVADRVRDRRPRRTAPVLLRARSFESGIYEKSHGEPSCGAASRGLFATRALVARYLAVWRSRLPLFFVISRSSPSRRSSRRRRPSAAVSVPAATFSCRRGAGDGRRGHRARSQRLRSRKRPIRYSIFAIRRDARGPSARALSVEAHSSRAVSRGRPTRRLHGPVRDERGRAVRYQRSRKCHRSRSERDAVGVIR